MEDSEIAGEIPFGWFLWYCAHCQTSLSFTREAQEEIAAGDLSVWWEAADWAISQVEHDMSRHN